mmetsp:Transcript_26255/g.38921  ORF Transcript_26255/g.38921 Transcript_26255/m.38921 type:complete len:239 (+) Transcript_26255:62-778(+)
MLSMYRGIAGVLRQRVSVVCFRGSFHSSSRLLDIVTVNVPALGESITEGSIATWEKSVGDSVNVDDVVAVVETDKVTVDIKSPYTGKIAELMHDEAATINVGSPLYSVDVDGAATETASASGSNTGAESSNRADSSSSLSQNSSEDPKDAHTIIHPSGRKSLIKFLGKRSRIPQERTHKQSSTTERQPEVQQTKPSSTNEKIWSREEMEGYDAAWLGRPRVSDEEIEAIESGGATLFG